MMFRTIPTRKRHALQAVLPWALISAVDLLPVDLSEMTTRKIKPEKFLTFRC
jgi:hypothetical protein